MIGVGFPPVFRIASPLRLCLAPFKHEEAELLPDSVSVFLLFRLVPASSFYEFQRHFVSVLRERTEGFLRFLAVILGEFLELV